LSAHLVSKHDGKIAVVKVMHMTSAHWAGDHRILHKECKSLARAGYDVVLLAPCKQDGLVGGVKIRAISRKRSVIERMRHWCFKLYKEALRENADVYHFHDPELLPIALLLKARAKRVVYDSHEDLPRALLSKSRFQPWLRRVLMTVSEAVENFVARRIDAVVAATPVIGERFAAINKNTVVVNNFPILSEIRTGSLTPWEEREDWVAYLGNVNRERGICDLINAMTLMPEGSDIRLKLAGVIHSPEFRRELESMEGWSRVDWLGYLKDRGQVADLLSRIKIGIAVVHPERAYMDGQLVKIYEYMAAGVPVIVSDFPRWRSAIEGCALFVPPKHPDAIAEAIRYLMTRPDKAQELGLNGILKVEQLYNWGREEKTLVALYDSLTRTCRENALQAA
jgi:glycosyltransferase involved in cell wall biosynthesis